MGQTITLKINQKIGSFSKDSTVVVPVDSEGTPLDRYWRSRLNDSQIDGCVTVLPKRSAPKKTPVEPASEPKNEKVNEGIES